MKLIIILICLGLERYLQIGSRLARFSWFEAYLKRLRSWIKPANLWSGWLGLVTAMLPAILLLGLVYAIIHNWVFGIVGLLLDVLVLLYCLGPEDLYSQVMAYIKADEAKEKDEAQLTATLSAILGREPAADSAQNYRDVTKAIVVKANERLFAVIFWFAVLGPVGALLYRMTVLLHRRSHTDADVVQDVHTAAHPFHKILDWLPARLTAFIYTLVGHFSASFGSWLKNLVSGLDKNKTLLTECGLQTLSLSDEDASAATLEENKNALDMIDRALIAVLVIVAVFTIGSWVA